MALKIGGSTSNTTSYIAPQKTALERLLSLYTPQAGGNNNVYPGERVAPLTDLQTGVMASVPNFLDVFGTPQTETQPLSAETGKTITSLLNQEYGADLITPEQAAKIKQQSIYDPMMQAMGDKLTATGDAYAGGNFFGSARGKAQERVRRDTGRTMAELGSNLDLSILNRNQDIAQSKAATALATVPYAMQYGNQPAENILSNLRIAAAQVEGMGALFGLGQAQQTQEQKEIEASIAQFAEEHQLTDPTNLAILMSLIGQTMSKSSSKEASFGF